MTAPLLPALRLIEGETLTGYVSRSAKLYETTPRDFCTDLGMRWPYLCSGHEDQIERLAWLIGKNPQKLREFSSGKGEIGRFKLGRALATSSVLHRTAVRFCPRCVTDALSDFGPHGVFQMKEWAVRALHSCPDHSCALMRLPTNVHSHYAYDFVSRVLDHVDEVQEASNNRESVRPTPLENYIRGRIRRGHRDDWLKDLDLMQIHRLSFNLGAAINGLKVKALRDLTDRHERRLCHLGFNYLKAGPDGFTAALQLLHQQSATERPYYSADMGPFYHWLKDHCDEPTLKPIVDLTCNHIFDTYPVPTGKEVFNRVAPEQIWLNMNEARKKSGFGVMFLKKLLGHIDGLDESEAVLRTDVHVDELANAIEYWTNLITITDTVSLLGISIDQLKSLQSCGILDSIKITSALRYFSLSQVKDLLQKLEELPATLPNRSVAPLKTYCHLKHIPIVEIIDLWVQGKLDGRLSHGEGVGLHAIEVDWSLFPERGPVELIGDLSPLEAARYLTINVGAIRCLRDSGYLTAISTKNPDTNHMKQFITRRSISEFERQYITLAQLGFIRKTRPIHLAMQLDRENIAPISCGTGHVRVYSKLEIERRGL